MKLGIFNGEGLLIDVRDVPENEWVTDASAGTMRLSDRTDLAGKIGQYYADWPNARVLHIETREASMPRGGGVKPREIVEALERLHAQLGIEPDRTTQALIERMR